MQCLVQFQLRAKCVYGGGGDQPDTTEVTSTDVGMILCIIFFVGLFMYFAAGFA